MSGVGASRTGKVGKESGSTPPPFQGNCLVLIPVTSWSKDGHHIEDNDKKEMNGVTTHAKASPASELAFSSVGPGIGSHD